MVFSQELGYDPEEWEECAEQDHVLALPLFTRVCLGACTLLLAALFFWMLEVNKRRGHLREVQEQLETTRKMSEKLTAEEEEELSAETRLEMASQEAQQKANPERRRSSQSKRELTQDERMALLAWREEVHNVEQERLLATEENDKASEEVGLNTTSVAQLDHQMPDEDQPQKSTEKPEGQTRQQHQQQWVDEMQEPKPEKQMVNIDSVADQPAQLAQQQDQKQQPGSQQQQQPSLLSQSSLLAKTMDQVERIAYADDLWPADASVPSHQHFELQQQLKRERELQPSPLLLLEVPKPKELSRLQAEYAGGATPPSTPPGGVPLAEKLPELAAHYRQMADQLTQKLLAELDEMEESGPSPSGLGAGTADAEAVAAQLQSRHRAGIDDALEEAGTPQEVRQQLAQQLETHVATVLSQEMRRRSSAALLPIKAEAEAEPAEGRADGDQQQPRGAAVGKKASSSSSEDGFVKLRAPGEEDAVVVGSSGDVSPFVAASPSSPPILLIDQHRLTPSPQLGGLTTDEDEPADQNVRISLFSASGGEADVDAVSTTADDIEFVASARPSPLPPPSSAQPSADQQLQQAEAAEEEPPIAAGQSPPPPSTATTKDRHLLEAQEAEQVMALLQEYDDLSNNQQQEKEAVERETQEDQERRRQFSSGAASSKNSAGGIISLPESAQPTPGGPSMPESPGSLGFDFVSFPSPTQQPEAAGDEQKARQMEPDVELGKKTTTVEAVERRQETNIGGDGGEEGDADAAPVASPTLLRKPEARELAEAVFAVEESKKPTAEEKVQAKFTTVAATTPAEEQKSEQMADHQKAEQFLQEALDYMSNDKPEVVSRRKSGPSPAATAGTPVSLKRQSTFIVEEEMLESEEGPILPAEKREAEEKRRQKKGANAGGGGGGGGSTTAGGDGTSKQIRTNEVFDKPDPMLLFDDADDRDITYAPEIQSMEVPPDQLSQADSLNLVDENFSEQHEAIGPMAAAAAMDANSPKPAEEVEQQQQQRENEEELMERREEGRGWRETEPGGKKQQLLAVATANEPAASGEYPEEEDEDNEEDRRLRRELTPRSEAELHREMDQIRRWSPASPRLADQMRRLQQSAAVAQAAQPPVPQVPQAPQFLRSYFGDESTSSLDSTVTSLRLSSLRQSSLLSAVGVTSTQEMLLKLTSLEALSKAMRKAGLESSNLIFGIDYTASNKYQGERSFGGRSLHSVSNDHSLENPYQQVIKIMGRTLAPFAGHEHGIPVFGFGDASTADRSVFPLNGTPEGECSDLEDVHRVYNRVTPGIDLSGPTNFAPLIYRAMEICHRRKDYHILVIIADGQVTNERATRKAIVSACQYPLSIIVVGVGDGPWDMMRVFDESLPKRPWDNFHFVEFHALVTEQREELTMHQPSELAFAVHSLLEIPDQYNTIRKLGMLLPTYYTRPQPHSPRSFSPKPQHPKSK